jgi:hypothetical protein
MFGMLEPHNNEMPIGTTTITIGIILSPSFANGIVEESTSEKKASIDDQHYEDTIIDSPLSSSLDSSTSPMESKDNDLLQMRC